MKLYNVITKFGLLGLAILYGQTVLAAEDINIAQKPLAVETGGVSPNILLILDESGSMVGSGAEDVFYSPGFDANQEYLCENVATEAIRPLGGNIVTVYVSNAGSTKGMPYFKYGDNYYTWGNNNQTSIDGHLIERNACFDTQEEFKVKIQASKSESASECTAWKNTYKYEQKTTNRWGTVSWSWKYQQNNCPSGSDYRNCQADTPVCSSSISYSWLSAINANTEELDGNFLNWYFSKTKAEWSDATLAGGFTTYSSAGNNDHHGFWTETAETSFNTSGTNTGLKSGVSYKHERLAVAKDVIKKLIRDTNNAFLGYMGYTTQSGGTYPARLTLRNGVVEFSEAKLTETNSNKTVMLEKVNETTALSGTPTSKALLAAFRYLFNGWTTQSFKFKDTTNTTISSTYGDFTYSTTSSTPGNKGTQELITADNWCQKNAFVVLTDGTPSVDVESPFYRNYKPKGITQAEYNALPTSTTRPSSWETPIHRKDLVSIVGAFYDHDFLPNLSNKKGVNDKTNVETFMIAFGAKSVVEEPSFVTAGKAGGGGNNNFFPAYSGAAIAQAFKDIFTRIQASAASVTAIAVSAVSEMRADNYAVQATYSTEFWHSQLKAFNLNYKGQFINVNDDPADENKGWDSSVGITPKWEANQKLNETYIVGNEAQRKKVRTRKVYTWHPALKTGVRFGADNMTRPTSVSAQFAPFTNLPENMRLDLVKRSGANAQEQYDLMMYLLGDISNEEGFEYSGCPASECSGKYRKRGIYDINTSKQVTSVLKGGFLGDVVDSSPVYVKEPPRPWDNKNFSTEEQRYSHYKEQMKDRTAMVYVGTNRGFLHGFAVEGSSAGQEIFAYMPNALTSLKTNEGYHYLASKNYDHRFYVDLTPTVSDVFMDFYSGASEEASPEWRTILIGGLRGGGKGYFALDITCPFKTTNTGSTCDDESFSGNNVLWEFTDKDDPDLGYTFGEPVIAKVFYSTGESDDGKNANGKGRWAAIVPNGYNSNDGRAVLFVLFLDGGRDGVWTKGKDYIKLYAGSSSEDKPTDKNGLSSATAIDLDGDGIVDQIYAGDVKGQMWSFDVRQSVVYQEN